MQKNKTKHLKYLVWDLDNDHNTTNKRALISEDVLLSLPDPIHLTKLISFLNFETSERNADIFRSRKH